MTIWGPYPNYDDMAKLEYGRILWKSRTEKTRPLSHWMNPLHPHAQRCVENRAVIEEILESNLTDEALDLSLRDRDSSLRAASREIPSVFGSL